MENENINHRYPTYVDVSSGMPLNVVQPVMQGPAQEYGNQPRYSVVSYPEEVDFGQIQYPSTSFPQPVVQYESLSNNTRQSMIPVRNQPIIHYRPRQSFFAQPPQVLNFPAVNQMMPNHGIQGNPTGFPEDKAPAALNQMTPVPNGQGTRVPRFIVQGRPEETPPQIFPKDSMHGVLMFKIKERVYQQLNQKEMVEAIFDLYSDITDSSPKNKQTRKRSGRPKGGKAVKKTSVKNTLQTAKKDVAGPPQSFKASSVVPFRWYTAQPANPSSKICSVKTGKKDPEHRCLRSCERDQNSTNLYDGESKGSNGENLNSVHKEKIYFTEPDEDNLEDYSEENEDCSEMLEEKHVDVMNNGPSAIDCALPEQLESRCGCSPVYLED